MVQINGDEEELLPPIRLKFRDKKLLNRRKRHLWREALRNRPHRIKSLKFDDNKDEE